MEKVKGKVRSLAKDIAYISVMCALLICGQFALSFVSGVEIVTLLLVCFSYVFGMRRGALCAVAFTLLRCVVFGAYPTVIILYLIYYPSVAIIFGGLGRAKNGGNGAAAIVAVNALLLGVAAACAALYFGDVIKISRLYKTTLNVMLWLIFGLSVGLCSACDVLTAAKYIFGKRTGEVLRLIAVTSVAAVCTICFTLLDDVITPLFFGYSVSVWMGYVYGSFTAMLPQTACTIVSMCTLFVPVTAAMKRAIPPSSIQIR